MPVQEITTSGYNPPSNWTGVVYFHNKQCGACVGMKPQIDWVAENHPEIAILACDTMHPAGMPISATYRITATPTLIFIKQGQPVGSEIGGVPAQRIVQLYQQYLANPQ